MSAETNGEWLADDQRLYAWITETPLAVVEACIREAVAHASPLDQRSTVRAGNTVHKVLAEHARAQPLVDPRGPVPIRSVRFQRGCGEATFRLLKRAAALKPRPDPRDARIAELEAALESLPGMFRGAAEDWVQTPAKALAFADAAQTAQRVADRAMGRGT